MPYIIKTYNTIRKLKIYPDIIIWRGTIILLVTVTLLFGLAIIWLNHTPSLQHIWNSFALDKKVPASFCETIGINNPVRQPINTFSNIIYLIIAIFIIERSCKIGYSSKYIKLTEANKIFSFIFGFILLYVFCASTFYHASLISIAYKLDYSAVFSFALFPVMFFLHRWWLLYSHKVLLSPKRGLTVIFICAFLTVNILLALLTPKGNKSIIAFILIMLFFIVASVAAIKETHSYKRSCLILSIASVMVALVWFEFDKNKVFCYPHSYFQLHSLWNLFIGISAFYFFLYMRSEYKSATSINNDVIKMQHDKY